MRNTPQQPAPGTLAALGVQNPATAAPKPAKAAKPASGHPGKNLGKHLIPKGSKRGAK